MRARVARHTAVLQAFLLLTALVLPGLSLAAVAPDQPDYFPGSVVTISGDNSNDAGYIPGETIDVSVSGPNGYTASCSGTANAQGDWSCQITLWNTPDAVGDYSYTATGRTSGVVETGTFTDATNVGTTLTLALGASTITLGSSVNLTGSLVATNGGDPAVPAGQTVHLNRYSGSSCPTGGATLVSNVSTVNPGGTFGPQGFTPATTGTFFFKAVFDGSDNGQSGSDKVSWQSQNSACLQLTVNPAPATVNTTTVAANASATFGAASVTLNATVTPASGPAVNTGSVTFTVNGVNVTDSTIVAGAASASLSLAGFNSGSYNITAVYTAGSGFNASSNAAQSPTPKLTIDKASSTTTVTCGAGPFTYTGSAIEPCTYTVTGAGGLSIPSTAVPAAGYSNNVNAGTASASFSYAGDANHTGSSDVEDFTIDKAGSTSTVVCPAGPYTYNGHAQTPCSASWASTSTDAESGSLTVDYGNNTNAGTATADASFGGDANHTGSTATQQTFTIDKANAICSFPDYSVVYDTFTHGAIGSCTGVDAGGAASGSSLNLGASYTFVPGGTAHWVFTGGTNYNDQSGDTLVTITTGFRIDGFYQPVDMSSHSAITRFYNSVKGGQTVPLKFRVFTLAGTELTATTGISVMVEKVSCVAGPLDPTPLPTDATGATELRYSGGNFIFNWAVPKAANSCYEVTVQSPDHATQMSYTGVSVDAFFKSK
jgi:hypothetical protein